MSLNVVDRARVAGEIAIHTVRTFRRIRAEKDLHTLCSSDANLNTQSGEIGKDTQRIVRDIQTIIENR